MNTIQIEPVEVWSAGGKKTADTLEVRYVQYNGATCIADYHLWGNDEEVSQFTTEGTAQQCADWTADVPFYGELAKNAGLVPV